MKGFLASLIVFFIIVFFPSYQVISASQALSASGHTARIDIGGSENIYFADVDKDGMITVADAILVLRYVVGLYPGDDKTFSERADVNFDGMVNVTDAILILRHIVGLAPYFPVNDPAYVGSERAFNYILRNTDVGTIALSSAISAREEILVGRDIKVISASDERQFPITGTLRLIEGVKSFVMQNVRVFGSVVSDTNGELSLDFRDNCSIYQAVFLSGNITVLGGKNIRGVYIAADVSVVFDYTPHLKPGIDLTKTFVELFSEKVVPAHEDNVALKIKIAGYDDSIVFADFFLTVESEDGDILLEEEISVDFRGEAVISFSVTEAAEYSNVLVSLNDIAIGLVDFIVVAGIADKESSSFHYKEVVTAGEPRIQLEIALKDRYGNIISGNQRINIFGDWVQPQPAVLFSPEGRGLIYLSAKTVVGDYDGEVYTGEDSAVYLGGFRITVKPGLATELFVSRPPGSSNSSGEVGEVVVQTMDRWGNFSDEGLPDSLKIEASAGEGYPLKNSSVKDIGKKSGNGLAVFNNLVIITNDSLIDTRLFFYDTDTGGALFQGSSPPFNILGFGHIDILRSKAVTAQNPVKAGMNNVELIISLSDRNGRPISGNFYTVIGDELFAGKGFYTDGTAQIILTETKAGDYRTIPVYVDGFEIDELDLTVEPGAAHKMVFSTDFPYEIFPEHGDSLDFSVKVTDFYNNVIPGQSVYLYCVYAETFLICGGFAGEHLKRTDHNGIAVFDDLVFNETAELVFLLFFEEQDVLPGNEPALWHRFHYITG